MGGAARRGPRRPCATCTGPSWPARTWGLAHLDELADAAAAATGVERGTCREYLEGLDYGLSYRHLAGLTDFLRRLAARGVVPDGTLSFVGAA